jgi:hypothetical protein
MMEISAQSLVGKGSGGDRKSRRVSVNLLPLRIHDKNNAVRKMNNPKIRLLR